MNKTHKGATLVEVLVAMTVFLIICGAIFTSVIGIGKIVVKQEQTLRIGYSWLQRTKSMVWMASIPVLCSVVPCEKVMISGSPLTTRIPVLCVRVM